MTKSLYKQNPFSGGILCKVRKLNSTLRRKFKPYKTKVLYVKPEKEKKREGKKEEGILSIEDDVVQTPVVTFFSWF